MKDKLFKRPTLIASLLVFAFTILTRGETRQDSSVHKNDVIAFIGGESVVVQNETGHLESVLTAAYPMARARCRNLGWEGDTVFEQPRDLNFPGVAEQLKRVGATVIIAEFGRAESLRGADNLPAFVAAYEKLCSELSKQTPRLVLVTPAPFEKPTNPNLPDLSARNDSLRAYSQAIVELAKRRGLACFDVSGELNAQPHARLTAADGLHLTTAGSAIIAKSAARQLGFDSISARAGDVDAQGRWANASLESLRQAIIAKNRLWFDYWRPMNWAFLGGDRMSVPSSRDPKDLTVRIFPRELEKFTPLIEQADKSIFELAQAAGAQTK